MKLAAEMSGQTNEKLHPWKSTFPNSIEVIAFATDANADWITLLKQMANTNKAVNHCCRAKEILDMFFLIHSLESVWGRKRIAIRRESLESAESHTP